MVPLNSTFSGKIPANMTKNPALQDTISQYCIASVTNSSSPPDVSTPTVTTLTWFVVAVALVIIGAAANLFMLVVILKSPSLRKGAGIFIAHLLACQVFTLTVIHPIAIRFVFVTIIQPDGRGLRCENCRYLRFFSVTLMQVVGWNEALLAINRLIGVFLPTGYRRVNQRIVHLFGLGLCWAGTLSFTLPIVFNYFAIYKMGPLGNCFVILRSEAAKFLMAFLIYAPMAICTLTALAISAIFWTGRYKMTPKINVEMVNKVTEDKEGGMSRRQKRISWMLVATFLVDFLCQLPQFLFVSSGLTLQHPESGLWSWCFILLQLLLTPVIFFVMNEDYRRHATALGDKLLRRQARSTDVSLTRGPSRRNASDTVEKFQAAEGV